MITCRWGVFLTEPQPYFKLSSASQLLRNLEYPFRLLKITTPQPLLFSEQSVKYVNIQPQIYHTGGEAVVLEKVLRVQYHYFGYSRLHVKFQNPKTIPSGGYVKFTPNI